MITVGSVGRLDERSYRECCAERLVEILVALDEYRGARRIFIP